MKYALPVIRVFERMSVFEHPTLHMLHELIRNSLWPLGCSSLQERVDQSRQVTVLFQEETEL
jgi:hypothetical protein